MEKSIMEKIREGLTKKHRPDDQDKSFVDSVYALFREFMDDYRTEWTRLDDNERMYHGDHWEGVSDPVARRGDQHMPKPATPIITSTIENLKADLSDEFPEAVIVPDNPNNELLAKILTVVLRQELDAAGWEKEYDRITQDVLNDGWCPVEVGYDPYSNSGIGCSYIRYVVNKNFMCDPTTANLQDGRAVFKMERKPMDWFVQRYPDYAQYIKPDGDLISADHDNFSSTVQPSKENYVRLIEAWFRVYDAKSKKYKIHFCKVAGGVVLENSAIEKPQGYYSHGLYPFIIFRLFPQKGSALGLGITDLFKDANRFSDKLDQILLINAYRASRPRLLVQKGTVDVEDVQDYANEVIEVSGAPAAATTWQATQPLPSYIMNYIQMIRTTIKEESGSNQQSRGGTPSGVTAASAITALQEMATKRSRMEARAIHYGFKECVRMVLAILREFDVVPREVAVTISGVQTFFPFDRSTLKQLMNGNDGLPIEHYVSIKTARQTKYSRMSHNELWLQMLQTLGGQVDPVIMFEGLEYDEKEELLDNIRRAQAGGMMALQQQVAQLSQLIEEQTAQIQQYELALSQSQSLLDQQGYGQGIETNSLQGSSLLR